MERLTKTAVDKGKEKAKQAFEASLTAALRGGAGPAHKMTAVDHALPPLRLIFEETTKEGKRYTTDPIKVSAKHTAPWCKIWGRL